ncbi:hypothetical protein HA50_05235 [Pantoea cypripedii]|uniref:Uncharacterized protein n=1 Tax=Pantoea cypripedii TaxID=55209 RepID=A0A1X1ES12_PANCY|nr:hypothetical protein HA50_05235 [Pantoea cypripedii]
MGAFYHNDQMLPEPGINEGAIGIIDKMCSVLLTMPGGNDLIFSNLCFIVDNVNKLMKFID